MANALILTVFASLILPMFFGEHKKAAATLCILTLVAAEFRRILPSFLQSGVLLLFGAVLAWGCVATVWSLEAAKMSSRWGGPGLLLLSTMFLILLQNSQTKIVPLNSREKVFENVKDLAS